MRFDDIDPPRAVAGAEQDITHCLIQHDLVPTGEIDHQSQHSKAYDQALAQLAANDQLFFCTCTRSTLGAHGCCTGHCREQGDRAPEEQPASLRIKVPQQTVIEFDDVIKGRCQFPLGETLSDFIVRRKDGLYAYQLAAAIDDGGGNISHVIRGDDLLDSTPRQIFLQQCLGITSPIYGHIPVILGEDGHKLSKQAGAPAISLTHKTENLRCALNDLGQEPPPLEMQHPKAILSWAAEHWDRQRIPR